MSKRAEIVQANAQLTESIISYAKEHTVMAGLVYREGIKFGYEQAVKDIISLIKTRIAEIPGDAQPNPILRIELQELIKQMRNRYE